MSNARVVRMNNESGCTWPKCPCDVPSYALSMHNRVDFCLALKALEQDEAEKSYQRGERGLSCERGEA
jgi:hypothetical protein